MGRIHTIAKPISGKNQIFLRIYKWAGGTSIRRKKKKGLLQNLTGMRQPFFF